MATKSTLTNNAQHAVHYLETLGWSPAQAAGLVGNFQQESGVNLNASAVGDGGKAYGIAQWQPDRQANFQKVYGFSIQNASLNQQLDFVNYELTKGNEQSAGAALRKTTNPTDAAVVVSSKYERAGAPQLTSRINYATALYNGPQGNPPPGLTPQEQAGINGRLGTPQGTPGQIASEAAAAELTFQSQAGGVSDPAFNLYNPNPDSIDVSQPLRNILHDYPSYTYGLSLHLLSADEYNNIMSGNPYIPNRVLIASAGRYDNTPGKNQFIRSPYFSDDFYFEDFTMTTVIGTNAHSRNTNAIEMKFTVIEPYGMTLINRLLDQANDPELNCSNYLDMVYLIQIDFFASDDTGEIIGIVPGITKRIPIKLIQMDITAGVKGSTYIISAVPYNHSAFETMTVSTPANFEISAGTVGEMFQSGGPSNKSFADALNGWNQDLATNNKVGVPDTYNFNIDPQIAQSAFNTSGGLASRDTGMCMVNDTVSIHQSNLGSATKDFNISRRNMSFGAGTSIDKVLDYSIRNSDYIQNQMAIPDGVDPQAYLQQKAQNANQPLNWYKITPQVTLGQFDPVRKIYARNVTYNVTPYTIYNVKSDVAPQGKATHFVKDYNYIYTGQNDDVLNFDINFNTLYYTAQTAYRSAMVSSIYKAPDSTQTTGFTQNQNSGAYQGSNQNANSVMPMVMKPQVYNAKARATGGSITAKSVAVADLEDSLMTLSAADMLNVQLTIVGDPQFIKQDDIYYTPTQSVSAGDPRLTPNGSLRTDYTEIYVSLMFRTPLDIDEDTGMMKFNENYRTSVFSGLYRVLTVATEFKNGQFIQVLNLIRLPYQAKYDYVSQPQSSSTIQRNSDITPDNAAILSASKNNPLNVGTPTKLPADDSGLNSQQQAQNLLQPGLNAPTKSQVDLSQVNNTAPTQTIDVNNQPQAVIPGR